MKYSKFDLADFRIILPKLKLSPEAASAVEGSQYASEALNHLMAADHLTEAVRLCAHALPAREAVWWSARCARATAPGSLKETDSQACGLAEDWVRHGKDEIRRSAMARAEATGFDTPEAWVAVAAFWSGDSISPPEQQKVPPPPHLTGTTVTGAVLLASVRNDERGQAEWLRRFLASAIDIANGGAGYLEQEMP